LFARLARIKARASTGRNRQFPYTDDYVDLDNLEKQAKATATATAAAATPSPSTTGRRSNRASGTTARSSSTPSKRISLRQQPIDAAESPKEKDSIEKVNADVYEQMDMGGENEQPDLSRRSIGRKRKSTTPVASTTTKRTRQSTTPQAAADTGVSTRQKQPSPPVTPKRGRKSAKTATPEIQSTTEEDRPVRIALSSHLVKISLVFLSIFIIEFCF